MIEEAAGTRLYESKKESAEKTIAKKDAKLNEIDRVCFFLRQTYSCHTQWSALDAQLLLFVPFAFHCLGNTRN